MQTNNSMGKYIAGIIAFLVAFVLSSGIVRKAFETISEPDSTGFESAVETPYVVPTPEQAREFALEVEKQFQEKPAETFFQFVSFERIIQIIRQDELGSKLKDYAGIKKQLEKTFQQVAKNSQAAKLFNASKISFVDIVPRDGKLYASFRMDLDLSLNYIIILCSLENDKVVGSEITQLSVGISQERFTANAMLDNLRSTPTFLDLLSPEKRKQMESAQKNIVKMSQACNAGKYEEAVRLFESGSLQKLNYLSCETLYLVALQTTAGKAIEREDKKEQEIIFSKIEKTIARIRKISPDNIGLDFSMLDTYFIQKKWDKLDSAYQSVLKIVGNDSHLYFLWAIAYLDNDKPKALKLLKQAFEAGESAQAFLTVYLSTLNEIPNSSKEEKQAVIKRAVELYGDEFFDSPQDNLE